MAQQPVEGRSLHARPGRPGRGREAAHTSTSRCSARAPSTTTGGRRRRTTSAPACSTRRSWPSGADDFDEDRWELFDLETDFSEAHDRAGGEPERLRHLTDLWTAEAARNNVLPISDGLVDRLAGFIPAAWPAGQDRVFRPGGGPVCDESVPLAVGRLPHDGGRRRPRGRRGERRGLRAGRLVRWLCPLRGGRPHALQLRPLHRHPGVGKPPSRWPPGATKSPSSTAWARARTPPGGWCSWWTAPRSARSPSKGHSPSRCSTVARGFASATTAGSRCRRATQPPAPFAGVVHQLRVEAPGALQADPDDEVRAALHAD